MELLYANHCQTRLSQCPDKPDLVVQGACCSLLLPLWQDV